jgi:hypothetical protein
MGKAALQGINVLRKILENACAKQKASLSDLTVLSAAVDPYRLDTPAGHRDGVWLASQLNELCGPNARIHWRGLHYAIVQAAGVIKPNGDIYRNTEADWIWLSENAGKAARWLGYIPFERIIDQRNSEPIIHRKAKVRPEARLSIGLDIDIPDADDIEPLPIAKGFVPRQAYQFVIFGEKSSLEDIVLPIAQRFEADLYLPQGEISDTQVYQIAKDANVDGRPLVVFTLSDCDPAGHQMPISIARKLQAFNDQFFPRLKLEVVRIALTPEQVKRENLPSRPMKDSEKRAADWREAFGIDQTEIDALTTPTRRQILERFIRVAFKPYIDTTLDRRVNNAKAEWNAAAAEAIEEQIDPEHLEQIREEASAKLEELRESIERINEQLNLAAGDHFELPDIEVPEPDIDLDPRRQALVSFEHDWVRASRALIKHKAYGKD